MRRDVRAWMGLAGWVACVALSMVGCGEDAQYQGNQQDVGADMEDMGQPEDMADIEIQDADNNGGVPDLPVLDTGGEEDAFEPACAFEDRLAPNQSRGEAHRLGEGVFNEDALYLCSGTSDWFAFQGQPGREVLVYLDFDPQQVDLDLYLYGAGAPEPIAGSDSPNNVEVLRYTPQDSGDLEIEVRGFEGGESAYALFVSPTCVVDADCGDGLRCYQAGGYCVTDTPPACGADDGYEPNESASTATPLTLPANITGISICAADEDYYRVTVPAQGGLEVALDYNTMAMELEILLFNTQGQLMGAGQDVREGKLLSAPYLPAGDYFVLVDLQGQQPPGLYSLSAELLQGSCNSDQQCSGVLGREFCDLATGTCQSIQGNGEQGLGERCDDDSDCDLEQSQGCYEGSEGGGDNLCTVTCGADGDCQGLGAGAYCLILDRPSRSGVCVPACQTDYDCSSDLYCDNDSKTCLSRACGVDGDCPREGEICLHSDANGGFGLQGLCGPAQGEEEQGCGVGEGPDAQGNNSSGSAAPVALDQDGAAFLEGLRSCDPDEDWYVVELTQTSNLTADVGFMGRGDMDVYILGEDGRTYGQGTTPENNPEQAVASYLPAGRYFVRVNQFPAEQGQEELTYTLSLNAGPVDCRAAEVDPCGEVQPLRVVCDPDSGACADFAGNGEVALGGTCDSNDDCNGDAELCWTFQGAQDGRNICTTFCQSRDGCDQVPGTQCVAIRRNAGVCIQGQ